MQARFAPALIAATLLAIAASSATAQTYPSKPIQMIINNAPGAGTDLVGRMIAQGLEKRLGQSIVVDNRAGAGGIIGAEAAKRAAPDGYNLFFTSDNMPILQALTPEKTVNILTDFEPIALAGTVDFFLAVSGAALAANNAQDLVRIAKAKPGTLSYGSGGVGGPQHLGMELFKLETGTNIVHVPYKGMAPAMTDFLPGRVQVVMTGYPALSQYVSSGKLKILAAGGPKRSSLQPDLPTLREGGIPVEVEGYFYLMAPKGTPAPILTRLNREMNEVLSQPDVRAGMAKRAITPGGGTAEQLLSKLRVEVDKWTKVIKAAGIKAE
jgi:tripartite-type tricarboxylate transporter receptor subunit TctC